MASTPKHISKPSVLNGFQAVMKPTEYGYSLQVIIEDPELMHALETEREQILQNILANKIKNPKRASVVLPPWEELETNPGQFLFKFSWDDEHKPAIVDALGEPITDPKTRIFNGSVVRVAFNHSGYVKSNKVEYGTKVRLAAVQVISISADGTVKVTEEDAAQFFGKQEGGFSINAVPKAAVEEDGDEVAEDNDF